MTSRVFDNAFLSIGGVDLSAFVQQVQLTYKADSLDDTAMGADTHSHQGGLKDWDISVDFYQDYAAAGPDDTLFSLLGTQVAIILRPDAGVVSATNPQYTGTGLIDSYEPAAGNIGQIQMAKTSIVAASTLARAVA